MLSKSKAALTLAGMAAVLAAFSATYFIGRSNGEMSESKRWQEYIEVWRAESDALLNKTRAANEVLEIENEKLKLDTHLRFAAQEKEIGRMYAANLALSDELSGLRDPGKRRTACPSTMPNAPAATDVSADGTATGTELSAEASQFLLEFARDADNAANYAKQCGEYSKQLETWLQKAYASCSGRTFNGGEERTNIENGGDAVR